MSRYRADEATITVWTEGGRLCLEWSSDHHWRTILESLKAYFPRHGDLSFDRTRKVWSTARRRTLEHWLAWTFERSAVVWEDATDAAHGGAFDCGTESHTPAQDSLLAAAYHHLHLLPTAPPELVTAAYRIAAQQHHPDRGGTTAAMAAVNDAVQTIRQHHERKTA